MSKNQFARLDHLPEEQHLRKMISNFEYKKVELHELPIPLDKNGLVSKCNSFILAASGSSEGMLYSFVGIRPDKGNVIDEHPLVFYYHNSDPSQNFGGIIHHGNWMDRTIPLSLEQISAISASGLTASFTYKSIPPGSSGSLEDLRNNGMLEGLSAQFDILLKNRKK
jgi:hypothetical protein